MQSNLIAQNIKIIQSEINTIAEKRVKLIAVSKKKPLAMIEQAFDLGINDFGENFAQELKEKAETSSKNITWHFIGPIQSNKIKDIAKYSNWVHSIEREKVAKKLNEHALMQNKIINSLIQVNIDSENSKSGVSLDALFELKDYILKNCENLNLRGLMFMPRFTLDKNEKDEILRVEVKDEQSEEEHVQEHKATGRKDSTKMDKREGDEPEGSKKKKQKN